MPKHYLLLMCLLVFLKITGRAQSRTTPQNVVITARQEKTNVRVNESGQLQVNVSPQNIQKYKSRGWVSYSNFGAIGNGKTDDIDAIAATHAFANQHGLLVKADTGTTYYISGKERTAIIQTDTDFGTARFIVDDTEVQNRNASVFEVSSKLVPFKPQGIKTLKRNQVKLDLSLPTSCIITAIDTSVKHYIRFGPNQDNGSAQTDIFIADKSGNVDMTAPIIWDFSNITDITAIPIEEKPLNITGGRFTTIANKAASKYTYYARNIAIRRSNVVVDGLEHRITGEGRHGAPYGGFITISHCAYVTIKNSILTGHKTYRTIGSAGEPVSMGSYDISVGHALHISFLNCRQTNDINDNTYWGIMGSNYCKNLLYDGCSFSRFDAHKGVANATIRNSTLGHMGINAIGCGTLTVESSSIHGKSIINLRSDYGSTWQGSFIIRNCILVPPAGKKNDIALINGTYSGLHDFGYPCYLHKQITIENLTINDSHFSAEDEVPSIFADFNPQMKDSTYQEKFPYTAISEVILRNVTTSSGKTLSISSNPYLFRNVRIHKE